MHQHPRPASSAAPTAAWEAAHAARTHGERERDADTPKAHSPLAQGSGSSEDFASPKPDQQAAVDNPAVQMQRLNQVIQNFHTKAALIILQSRVELGPAYSRNTDTKRVNRWFNLDIDETDDYKDDIRRWKTCDVDDHRPPPLVIELVLTTESLHQGQRLVILDDDGKRWDVMNTLAAAAHPAARAGAAGQRRAATDPNEVVLERWVVELGDAPAALPPDLASLLPLVYKKSIVFFRSLYTYTNFLPSWKLARKFGKSRSHLGMKLGYRFADERPARPDGLDLRLYDSPADVLQSYAFGTIDTPAGPITVQVEYRSNCDFRIDDSEELLSSRFLGADDDLFRPSLSADRADRAEVGSLPVDRRQHLLESPDVGLAYGSLSTYHQAGISTGTSPISALRNAQDFSASSPPTPDPVLRGAAFPAHHQQPAPNTRTSLRALAANRRSSFSVQPFKAPPLSASPLGASPLAASPRTHSARVPTLGSLTEEGIPPAAATRAAGRRTASLASDAVISSTSSSPRPATGARYSSSFSHRRARLSSGGTTVRTDEDQTSSGRASATSSAQPGSGLVMEAAARGGSSSSVAEDDGENISGFLKMLEQQKDLLAPQSSTAAEAATRRTAAALHRFHRMRDSNAALSDSMSSSMMLQPSSASSSRQLSGVPPMVAATSISTSSSPGKPISPHTPHTPFAPSRLSAAYSHDDGDTPHRISVGELPSPSDTPTEETTQDRTTAHVPAIDIPSSPRPFLPSYQRSSSAQRRPLSAQDDIADLYGMRSASMGADRPGHQREAARQDYVDDPATDLPEADDSHRHGPIESPHRGARTHPRSAGLAADGGGSESGSGRSSTVPFRSRAGRSGLGRGATPPPGSTSSFSGTGASMEHAEGSVSGSWGRGAGKRRGSRPDNRFDEDEFLPFAMEKSDFTSAGRADDHGAGASDR